MTDMTTRAPIYDLIEVERRRHIQAAYHAATYPPLPNHACRVALLILALDLLEVRRPYKRLYEVQVGDEWAIVWFSTEALALQRDVHALIERLNAQ